VRERITEAVVGSFVLMGILALIILAFKVSGFANTLSESGYFVTAQFDNVGDLKARAPVTIGGVRIGEVESISLDRANFKAVVRMRINADQNKIPSDSEASIYTAGLLGSNYIGLTPGFEDSMLANGSQIIVTHPALILENLIGQLVFHLSNGDKKDSDTNTPLVVKH